LKKDGGKGENFVLFFFPFRNANGKRRQLRCLLLTFCELR